ncbi:MAG: ribonuclease P protein component [Pseudomonadales bacterium]|nr:ribonuclease P protein component [Pseudomonadales bacterium]
MSELKTCLEFGPERRLLKAVEFQRVFDSCIQKVGSEHFLLLATPSNCKMARLGLIVPKKKLKRAVDRNRIKRISREVFRHTQWQLLTLDVILMARSGLQNLESKDVALEIQQNIKRLLKRLNASKNPQS